MRRDLIGVYLNLPLENRNCGFISSLRRENARPQCLCRRLCRHARLSESRRCIGVSPQFQIALGSKQGNLKRFLWFGNRFQRHERPPILAGPILVPRLLNRVLVISRIIRLISRLRQQGLDPLPRNRHIVISAGAQRLRNDRKTPERRRENYKTIDPQNISGSLSYYRPDNHERDHRFHRQS